MSRLIAELFSGLGTAKGLVSTVTAINPTRENIRLMVEASR
ncbi:MAG: hypothetical protein AAF913_01790 [Pseudomonadota bacterium]